MENCIFNTLTLMKNLNSVVLLKDFINELGFSLMNIHTDQLFQIFIDDVIIGCENIIDYTYLKSKISKQSRPMLEILNENIHTLLQQQRKSYVQTYGYKLSAGNGSLICGHFNIGHKILLSKNFLQLLNLLGDDIIIYLLNHCLIITRYQNKFYLQIAGPSIVEYFWSADKENLNDQANGYIHSMSTNVYSQLPQHFEYRMISRDESKREFNHRLNRNMLFFCSHMNREPGLFKSSIFEQKNLTNQQIKDKLLAQIFKTKKPNNESMNNLIPILAKFIYSYQSINLNSYMGYYCMLPKEYNQMKKMISSICKSHEDPNKSEIEELYTKLFENHITFEQVYRLTKKIIKQCLPKELLGLKNTELFLRRVQAFIQMKRFETFAIKDLIADFNIFEVCWLKFKYNKKYIKLIESQNIIYIEQLVIWLFNEFLIPFYRCNFYVTEKHGEFNKVFYYRKPLWKLISKLAIHFFEENNLEPVSSEEAYSLQMDHSYPISKLRILPKKTTFRPIMTFYRKNKYSQGRKKLSLNQMLSDAQIVLRKFKELLGQDLGFSVFDDWQIMTKYQKFYTEWIKKGRPKLYFATMDIQKCYDSINTDELLKFLEDTNYIENNYLLCRYGALFRNKTSFRLSPFNKQTTQKNKTYNIKALFNYKERVNAIKFGDIPFFEKFFNEIYDDNKIAILVDLVCRKTISKTDIIKDLTYICKKHHILFEKKYYVQKKGIPQGLNISSIISSFYYATLEERYIGFIRHNHQDELNLVMRLTDDYLIISSNQLTITKLLDNLFECAANNSFQFNERKLTTNFTYFNPHTKENSYEIKSQVFTTSKDLLIMDVICLNILNDLDYVKWIGKLINMDTLEILPGFSIEPDKMLYSVNVKIMTKKSISFVKNKLKSLLMNHAYFYLNPKINSHQIRLDIYKAFSRSTILKIYGFFEELRRKNKIKNLDLVLLRIIKNSIEDFIFYSINIYKEYVHMDYFSDFLKICYQEFQNFIQKKRANYPLLYKGLCKLSKINQDISNKALIKKEVDIPFI